MRVLLLAQFYPPVIGGEERHVRDLGHALARRGHEVAVLTLAAGRDAGTDRDGPVTVHAVRSAAMRLPVYSDPTRPHATPLPDPLVVREISRVVRRERPDVLHGHNWIVNSALPVARRGGAPLVLTLHDYSHVCATKRAMRDGRACLSASTLTCLRCAAGHYGPALGTVTATSVAAVRPWREGRIAHLIAVSRAVAERNGLPAGSTPWSVIPNFVPAAPLTDPAPGERIGERGGGASGAPPGAAGDDDEFILFVGDLSRDKGLDVLLAAHAELGPGAPRLLAVGRRCPDTPAQPPPNVELIGGGWPHERVRDAFARCLFAVAPSRWPDPCPTTVLEGMAAARPVITTRTGGMPDMVTDGVSGLLVPPGSVTALRDAMRRLLDDPAARAVLGRAARQRVTEFTDDAVAGRVEDVYTGVLRARAVAR